MKKIIFILFLFYLTHIEIFSETVFLRDGTVLHGKLKSQAINEIVIRIDEVEQKISKKIVFRVLYRDMSEEEAKKVMLEEIKKLSKADQEKLLSEMKDESFKNEVNANKPTETFTDTGKDSDSSDKTKIVTKWNYFWWSAAIPGYGHIRAKNYKTGIFYSVLFFGTAIFAINMNNRLNDAVNTRDQKTQINNILTLSAGGPSSALLLFFGSASDTQSEDQRILGYKALLYGSLGALSAVYAIQLINIYITGTKIEKTQTKSGFNFYTAPEFSSHTREMGHYNGISYTFSF
jgi:hypothetical protein